MLGMCRSRNPSGAKFSPPHGALLCAVQLAALSLLSCEGKHRNFGPSLETATEAAFPPSDAGTIDSATPIPLCHDLPECPTEAGCGPRPCLECTDDGHCPSTAPICDRNSQTCVECLSDGHCLASASRCHPQNHTCEQCIGDAHCSPPTRCDASSFRCTGCTNDGDCLANGGLCRSSDGVCVECLSSGSCRSPTTGCEEQSGTCVQCLDDATCLEAQAARCEREEKPSVPGTRFTCVRCQEDAECSGKPGIGPYCGSSGACVSCRSNVDCAGSASRPRCGANGECSECASDDDCVSVPGRIACRAAESGALCVECTEDTHCVGHPNGPSCQTDPLAANPNTCVQCNDDLDCQDASASRCEQGSCAPCETSEDCHLSGLRVCDTSRDNGLCVECTGPERQACGAFVCDSIQRECSPNTVGTAAPCEPCVSDAQCEPDLRCLPQTLQGINVGFFCFPLQVAGNCPRGFDQITTSVTIDGQMADVCLQRATTCPAFVDYGNLKACLSENDDGACGHPSVADGACVLSTAGFVCTINCEFVGDCAVGVCSNNLCPQ